MPKTLTSSDSPDASADSSSHRELSAMIDAGRAFSGHERNCCFLNSADGKFANLSAGSGLDFPDDGRALAVTDWDQDGDLDLWISNRNAPRLRLLRNDVHSANHHLALRLVGDGKRNNRDAIGARVEIKLPPGVEGKRLVGSLRAGEGFLSQSSKWLHFGLGSNTEIQSVAVRWPDGAEESFTGIVADRRYLLEQGSGRAAIMSQREQGTNQLLASKQAPSRSGGPARIPAVTLLKAPKINPKRRDGSAAGAGGDRSQLINLWATWCAPCLKELEHFRDRAGELQAAGVDVLALNVDGIGSSPTSRHDPAAILADLKFPFPATAATEPLLAALQDMHDRTVGLNRPLPVPTSFLIDPQGRLSVIYKGPVSVEQLLEDLNHSKGTLAERLRRSAQIDGSTIAHPAVRRAAEVQEASIQHRYGHVLLAIDDLDSAEYHFRSALELDPRSAASAKQLAQISLARRDWAAAAKFLQMALKIAPHDADGHQKLGQLYASRGEADQAQRQFEIALQQQPQHAAAIFGLATLFDKQGDAARALPFYEAGLRIQPDNQMATNNLAWLLATHPDDAIKDPKKALRLARELHAASGGKIPQLLDTLAAAEAAGGNCQAATAIAKQAIDLAVANGDEAFAAELTKRLTMYRSAQPFIEHRFAR